MDGQLDGGVVYVGGDGRQRFYDASGYGRPLRGPERDRWGPNGVALSRVEAAHLLARGDLDRIRTGRRSMGFGEFLRRAGGLSANSEEDGPTGGRDDGPAGDRVERSGGGRAVGPSTGRGQGRTEPGFLVRFLVYADLRERGFYLSPAREGWPNVARAGGPEGGPDGDPSDDAGNGRAGVDPDGVDPTGIDYLVYARGSGPAAGEVVDRVRAVGERAPVAVQSLAGPTLAAADEESDVSYFQTGVPELSGTADYDPPAVEGTLLTDRAVVEDPPPELYREGFYGRPLVEVDADEGDGEGPLQLSLVEAAHLAAAGARFESGDSGGDDRNGDRDRSPDGDDERREQSDDHGNGDPPALVPEGGRGSSGGASGGRADREDRSGGSYRAVVARGRAVEGERFDRRLRAYADLRARGVVPKTGFKFGADFRTYGAFDGVADLDHSDLLVRVFPADAAVTPRDLALDVRLAHGVRKRMAFALVGESVDWRVTERATP